MRDHPMIEQMESTGYPEIERNCGTDWQGNEIFEGDSIVFDPNTGESIPEDTLEDYLVERLGFVYKTAEQEG